VAAARSCLLAHGPAGTACTAPCYAWTASERAFASVWRVKAWHLISEPVRCRSSLSLIATPLRSRGHVRRRRRRNRPWWMSVTQVARYRRSMNSAQRPARHGLGHVTPTSVASCWLSQRNRRQRRPCRPARPVSDVWRPALLSSPDRGCSSCTIGYLALAAGLPPRASAQVTQAIDHCGTVGRSSAACPRRWQRSKLGHGGCMPRILGQVAGPDAEGEVMAESQPLAVHIPTVRTSDQANVRPSCHGLVLGGRDGHAQAPGRPAEPPALPLVHSIPTRRRPDALGRAAVFPTPL